MSRRHPTGQRDLGMPDALSRSRVACGAPAVDGPRQRLIQLVLLLLTGMGLSTISCGSARSVCEGNSGHCGRLTPEHCQERVGCRLAEQPICVTRGYGCALSDLNGTPCSSSNCFRDGSGGCRTVCSALETEDACATEGGGCRWIDGACTTACEAIDDATKCTSNNDCTWLSCGGKARDCEEFSGDECPTWLGCERAERGGGFSTQ
jgi:hypothetical protein